MPRSPAKPPAQSLPAHHTHVGHWLRLALERFDARVLVLMAQHPAVPLGLANLATRGQVGAAHVQITRHLPTEGARQTALARRAGMSKQAMGALVTQCEAWGMVTRVADPADARAHKVVFTATGLEWHSAYAQAAAQAEAEMRAAVGAEVTTVVTMGLEAYASQ